MLPLRSTPGETSWGTIWPMNVPGAKAGLPSRRQASQACGKRDDMHCRLWRKNYFRIGKAQKMPADVDYNQRGLIKLMLKMPALRGRLQVLSKRSPELMNLCGAFEEASETLERLIHDDEMLNIDKIKEYKNVCQEIENEVIYFCSNE